MGIKSFLVRPFAKHIARAINRWSAHAVEEQEKIFQNIIKKAGPTAFGKDHQFEAIHSYTDFVQRVPIRDYEALRPYFDRVKSGEPNVLWPGKPRYFAKTSGTTSGVKYI
ncbi:MAG: GH3 auxin-responsive promoter family protein, partial [Haliscomenobacter sp.]